MTPNELKQSIAEIETAAGKAREEIVNPSSGWVDYVEVQRILIGKYIERMPPGLLAAMCELASAAALAREAKERWFSGKHLEGESEHAAIARYETALATFRTTLEAAHA